MLKNILLQFTDLYNMTCVYCREEDKLSVCIKWTPSCFQKKEIKTLLLRLNMYVLTSNFRIFFPLKYHLTTLERQPNHLNALQQGPSDRPTIWVQCSVTRVSWCSVFSHPIGSFLPFWRVFEVYSTVVVIRATQHTPIYPKPNPKNHSHSTFFWPKKNVNTVIRKQITLHCSMIPFSLNFFFTVKITLKIYFFLA